MRYQSNRPRGVALHEAMMAVAVAAVLLSGVAQIFGFLALKRRSLENRVAASRRAGNLMEQLVAVPWPELNEESSQVVTLREATQREMGPEPSVDVEVTEDDLYSKRISIEIHWKQNELPYRLTAWSYQNSEATP